MTRQLRVGDITVDAIDDGVVHLPPTYYPGARFPADSLGPNSTYDIPIGCFLVRAPTATVLVDAGLGPFRYPFPAPVAAAAGIDAPPRFIAEGGLLLAGLREFGVGPGDISTAILTHLHADHIGWIGTGTFGSAEVLCSAADWSQPLVDPAPGEEEGRAGLESLHAAGRLRLLGGGRHEITAGVVAEVQGGHTPGHIVIEIGSELLLIGDAVHHPDQLNDRGVSFLLEHDPADALRAREDLFARVAGRKIALGMAHWRGLDFQVVEAGSPRTWHPA